MESDGLCLLALKYYLISGIGILAKIHIGAMLLATIARQPFSLLQYIHCLVTVALDVR